MDSEREERSVFDSFRQQGIRHSLGNQESGYREDLRPIRSGLSRQEQANEKMGNLGFEVEALLRNQHE